MTNEMELREYAEKRFAEYDRREKARVPKRGYGPIGSFILRKRVFHWWCKLGVELMHKFGISSTEADRILRETMTKFL